MIKKMYNWILKEVKSKEQQKIEIIMFYNIF